MLNIENWLYNQFDDVAFYGGSPPTDLRVNCPFCPIRYGKVDAGRKLHVSLVKQTCHCFRCNYSTSWVKLVMDVSGLAYSQAIGELYVTPKISTFDMLRDAIVHTRAVELMENALLPDGWSKIIPGSMEARYLTKRGFGSWYVDRYSLGTLSNYPGRVVIPIEAGYWQARAVYSFMAPKYAAPKMEARSVIFNAVALELYEEVVLCEGAFSAMSVGKNAVGLLRNKATKEQLRRLLDSSVDRFIVALDADAAANAVILGNLLMRGGKDALLWLYKSGDPADGGGFDAVRCDFAAEVETRLLR